MNTIKDYANSAKLTCNKSKKRMLLALGFLSALDAGANLAWLNSFITSIVSDFENGNVKLDITPSKEILEVEEKNINIQEPSRIQNNTLQIKTFDASNEISFNEAFSISREELGAGNVFEWKGKLYNTYYKEEWAELSDTDKNNFAKSIPDNEVKINDPISKVDLNCEVEKNIHFVEEKFIGSQFIELDNGQDIMVGVFSRNGHHFSKIDVNRDGKYDFEYSESNPTELKGLNGMEDISVNDISAIDNGLLISTEVSEIDGHISIVRTYSDNSQDVIADLDGDGDYELIFSIDEDGVIEENEIIDIDPNPDIEGIEDLDN